MSILIEEQKVLPFVEEFDTIVYTIGYEGYKISDFIWKLRRCRIERVLDVRKNPISRKPGFSKKIFKEMLEQSGIEYIHIPQLGIPSSYRTELDCQADYDRLFDFYEKEILSDVPSFIEQAAHLVQEKPTVLVCFEKNPKQCHRTRLAQKIAEMYGYPVRPF